MKFYKFFNSLIKLQYFLNEIHVQIQFQISNIIFQINFKYYFFQIAIKLCPNAYLKTSLVQLFQLWVYKIGILMQ